MTTVTISVELSDEFIQDILDNCLATCNTWGWSLVTEVYGDHFILINQENNDRDREYEVNRSTIIRGIRRILAGVEGLHPSNATDTFVGVRQDDAGMIDADQCDYIVQAALFNEVIYG